MKTTLLSVMVLSMTVLTTGCAATRDSILLGAGLGTGAGGAVGLSANHHGAGAPAIGAVTGAAIGGLVGLLIHHSNTQSDQPVGIADNPTKADLPLITKPEVRSIWIPPQIEDDGRRYVEGHRVYLLEKQSTFSQ